MYRDGRYYKVPSDLREENDLGQSDTGKEVRQQLQSVLKDCPTAPTEKAGGKTKQRPTYPDWKNLVR